jgi:hypothetical protein
MSRIVGLCVAVSGLLLVSPAAVAAPVTSHSCDLISPGAAAELFGAPLDPARDMVASCAYFGVGGDDHKGLIVALMAIPGMNMAQMYPQLLHSDPKNRIEPVSGLGEQANFVTAPDGMISLEVLYRGKVLDISASNSPNPNIKPALLQTMRQALQKL